MASEGGPTNQYEMGTTVATDPPAAAPPPGHAPPEERQHPRPMLRPMEPPGCLSGLGYLTHLDQISVHQQVGLFELRTSLGTGNKYQIKNSFGQEIYFAVEESPFAMRLDSEANNSFVIHITNYLREEVIRVVRPQQCCAGCFWCADCWNHCARTISVEAPPGQPIGHVRQRGSMWTPNYDILDASFHPLLKLRGPSSVCEGICCTWACDVDFRLMTYDETQQVGKITKQSSGVLEEVTSDADDFCITFPKDLDVKVKSTLLGTVFLIDSLLCKTTQQNDIY